MDFNKDDVVIEVTPLEKKSIEQIIEIWDNDTERSVTITERYRWGRGFLEHEYLEYNLDPVGTHRCDPNVGHGCDLDDLTSVWFDYDGDWTEEQKEQFEDHWENGDADDPDSRSGCAWLWDFQEEFEIEDDCVEITGPVRFSIVGINDYTKVYVEDYKFGE